MKWLLTAFRALVVIGLVITGIGMLLPRDHVVAMSARIKAPQAAVWKTVSDPSRFPVWRRDIERIEMLPPAPTGPAWREHSRHGLITMVMELADPPFRLVTRVVDDDVPFGGAWECIIEPDGASMSRVTITEHGTVSNPVIRFFSRFVIGRTASIEGYLRALGEHFGAEPIPVVVPVARAGGEDEGISHGI